MTECHLIKVWAPKPDVLSGMERASGIISQTGPIALFDDDQTAHVHQRMDHSSVVIYTNGSREVPDAVYASLVAHLPRVRIEHYDDDDNLVHVQAAA